MEIGNVKFNHSMREANVTTHELAKHCYDNRIICNRVDGPPLCILQSLVNDVSVLR